MSGPLNLTPLKTRSLLNMQAYEDNTFKTNYLVNIPRHEVGQLEDHVTMHRTCVSPKST